MSSSEQAQRRAEEDIMKTRFIKSITATAKSTEVRLPFERGAARAAMIARRKAAEQPQLKRA
jgi:hypothetical protein